MKCLNRLCNEEVPVGNYCPTHALSAGTIWKNIDEPASEHRDPLSDWSPGVSDSEEDDPSGREPGDGGNDGGSL